MRSGTGDSVMEGIAARMLADAQENLERMIGKIEPALVLVTSFLVGVILLSVMLPLMNIMSAIG
jgi:type IV pilus assembly protein PilC